NRSIAEWSRKSQQRPRLNHAIRIDCDNNFAARSRKSLGQCFPFAAICFETNRRHAPGKTFCSAQDVFPGVIFAAVINHQNFQPLLRTSRTQTACSETTELSGIPAAEFP